MKTENPAEYVSVTMPRWQMQQTLQAVYDKRARHEAAVTTLESVQGKLEEALGIEKPTTPVEF